MSVLSVRATQTPLSHDPLLLTIHAYEAGLALFNSIAPCDENTGKIAKETWEMPWNRLCDWQEPAQTREGALAALRVAAKEMESMSTTEFVQPMVRAALAFFESENR